MPSQVCTGAALQCSFGSAPSTFAASGVQVDATAAAGVVSDVTPSNVPPFALCTSLANPQVAAATSAAMGALTPQPFGQAAAGAVAAAVAVTGNVLVGPAQLPFRPNPAPFDTWNGLNTIVDYVAP